VLQERVLHITSSNECGQVKLQGTGIGSGQFCDCSVVGSPPITPFSNVEIVFLPKDRCLIVLFFILIYFKFQLSKERNHICKLCGEKHGVYKG